MLTESTPLARARSLWMVRSTNPASLSPRFADEMSSGMAKSPIGIEAQVGVCGRTKLIELHGADDNEGNGNAGLHGGRPSMEPSDTAAGTSFVLQAIITFGRLNRSAGRTPNTTLVARHSPTPAPSIEASGVNSSSSG